MPGGSEHEPIASRRSGSPRKRARDRSWGRVALTHKPLQLGAFDRELLDQSLGLESVLLARPHRGTGRKRPESPRTSDPWGRGPGHPGPDRSGTGHPPLSTCNDTQDHATNHYKPHRGITPDTSRTFTPLIDAKAASTLLGVPYTWLLAQARAGQIPHHRLGHYVRFNADDLHMWLSETRIVILGLSRADAGTRTPDPFITSEVLYQLSYVGAGWMLSTPGGDGWARSGPSLPTAVLAQSSASA
jgi:excisionase family DNA binding protein